jgi:hypothetical protein
LRKQAVDLLADIEDFIKEDPQGRRGLRDSAARVQADINGVLTKMEQGQLEATNARIEGFDNNLKGVRRELESARSANPGTRFGVIKHFGADDFRVDRIPPGDGLWIDDKAVKLSGANDPKMPDLKAQAELHLKAAQQPSEAINGRAPSVQFDFRDGIPSDAADALEAVQVNGQHLIVSGPRLPPGPK